MSQLNFTGLPFNNQLARENLKKEENFWVRQAQNIFIVHRVISKSQRIVCGLKIKGLVRMKHSKYELEQSQYSISVIIPNRNDGPYLERCISSVMMQRVPPDELIILDDVSTDNSLQIIERLIHDCPYARLHKNPINLGAVENSNLGLSLAKGKYVHFLGANDFVLPGFYEQAKICLTRYPAGLWSAMLWQVDESNRYLRIHPSPVISLGDTYFSPKQCRNMMFNIGNWLTGQSTVYVRKGLNEVGGFDRTLNALGDLLAAHVVASRYGASFTPLPLAVMRVHQGAFLTETLEKFENLKSIIEIISDKGPIKEPELFTDKMLERTKYRFYFSSLKISNGKTLNAIACEIGKLKKILIKTIKFVPREFVRLRTVLFFVIMRPFDIVQFFWYRLIGTIFINIKEYLYGRLPPKDLERVGGSGRGR